MNSEHKRDWKRNAALAFVALMALAALYSLCVIGLTPQ